MLIENDLYESARLEALHDSNLLDTPSSFTINYLLELAKQFFDVKIVAISLIDEERQWFKAQIGLDVCQTPRDVSFCTHTISQEEPLIIPDTLEHGEFANNSLVTGAPFIRAYSGVQLTSKLGYKIGAFCLIDDVPRSFSHTDVENQKRFAVLIEMELNRLSATEVSASPAVEHINQSMLKALHVFLKTDDHNQTFAMMLSHLLLLSESQFGFICEVKNNDKESLKLHAISKFTADGEKSPLIDDSQTAGFEFFELNNIPLEPLTTLRPIILNDMQNDSLFCTLLPNNISVSCYCGIPIMSDNEIIGMIGLANRKSAYSEEFINAITAVTLTIGLLIKRHRLLTETRALNDSLNQAAHFDEVTGLPNRRSLSLHMQSLLKAQSTSNRFAVCFLDLDGFKAVNDLHGHEFGDAILQHVAKRLSQFANDDSFIARLGGDEFVIVLKAHSNPIYQKIIDVLASPFYHLGEIIELSASAGVAIYPEDGDEIDTLLRHADQAMYTVKQDGKNKYAMFDINAHNKRLHTAASAQALINALQRAEIVPYLQAKFSMDDKSIIGFEVLSRWLHPGKGELSPGLFLPDIQDTQAQIEHDDYILSQCIGILTQLHNINPQFTLNINVSSEYLNSDKFLNRIIELSQAYPQKVGFFILEIVESTSLGELSQVKEKIKVCQNLGYSVSLDDFGTSYSSLTYFRALPVNEVKIDKSFVDDMLDDPYDLAIIKGIIDMATAFSRTVVAEGVETESQYQKLKEIGCHAGQGYLFAKPMAVSLALEFAKTK